MDKTKLVRPVLAPHLVTSGYGKRILNGKEQFHKGIDYINKTGDCSVVAIADGKCISDFDSYDDKKRWTDLQHSAGNMIVLEHEINGERYYIRYLHLGKNFVKVGQIVARGDKIGIYGDYGISYGAHLHIDMWDKNWKQIDPTPILLAGF